MTLRKTGHLCIPVHNSVGYRFWDPEISGRFMLRFSGGAFL